MQNTQLYSLKHHTGRCGLGIRMLLLRVNERPWCHALVHMASADLCFICPQVCWFRGY